MILRKVIVDGKETYLPITRDEAKVAIKNEEDLVFTDEDEKDDLIDEIEDELEDEEEDEIEDEEDQEEEELEEEVRNVENDLSGLGESISNLVNKSLKGILNRSGAKFTKDTSANPKSKVAQLMKVLPFMDANDLHEFIEEIINGKESLEFVNINAFLPFLEQEDCDALFKKAVEDGNTQFDPIQIAPFVSEKSLSYIVDQYLNGQFQDISMDALYPFLSSHDLKRVFKHILSKKDE